MRPGSDTTNEELARLRARVDELTADKEALWAERTTLVTCLGLDDALVKGRESFVNAVLSAACKSADFLAGFKAARDRAFAAVRDSATLDPIECSMSIRNMRPDNATTPRAKLLSAAKDRQQP